MKNNFKRTILKISSTAKSHKVITTLAILVLIGGGYWTYKAFASSDSETKYILGTVERSTIISAVSGSGQVSSSDELDIQPKVSGEIVSINVVAGQKVSAGTLIAILDTTNALKTIRDAEISLESAQLSLDKLNKPADNLSLIQAENALAQAEINLKKAYDDGFNSVSDAFLNLPGVMTGLEDIIYGKDVGSSKSQDNISAYSDMIESYDSTVVIFRDDAKAKYQKARTAYDATFLKYRSLTRTSSEEDIKNLIVETYDTAKIIADAVKSTNDFLGFVEDKLTNRNMATPSILTTHEGKTETYTSSTNSNLLSLLSIKNTIISAEYTITEKTQSLADLKAGADEIDLKSAQLSLKQKQNSLTDAKNVLADYYVRAPFAGVIASINAKKYDTAGSGTAIATLVTDQKIAELSLNEVDAAKVNVGDKAMLTFDAIEDLTLTGEVAEVDTVGTVSQGVVSYTVKIGFSGQDERIKSGMTVNASIQTEIKQDTLIVPSGAVKTQNGISFVQVFDPALETTGGSTGVTSDVLPKQVEVVVGITDDTDIEIISGLEEGQQIVVRTSSGSSSSSSSSSKTSSSSNKTGMGGPMGF